MLLLVTYGEVRQAVSGTGDFDLFQAYGRASGWGTGWVAATCLLGLAGMAIAAIRFRKAAFNGFDAAVGRPCRTRRLPLYDEGS
jgi:hypothetical protein